MYTIREHNVSKSMGKMVKKSIQQNSTSHVNETDINEVVDEIECNESRGNPEKFIPETEILKEISISVPTMYSVEIENHTETESLVNETEQNIFTFDFNDPSSWPPITDKIRSLLINHGPEQGKH